MKKTSMNSWFSTAMFDYQRLLESIYAYVNIICIYTYIYVYIIIGNHMYMHTYTYGDTVHNTNKLQEYDTLFQYCPMLSF